MAEQLAVKMMEGIALVESASSVRAMKRESNVKRNTVPSCPFRLVLCQPFEELLSQNTKQHLSAGNAYSIKLDTLPFTILETEVFRRAFPNKTLLRLVLNHLVGMRILLTSNTTRVVVQNLSNVPIRVHQTDKAPKLLSSAGAVADMTHGTLLTLFEFPPEHEFSHFPPLQYRVVHANVPLGLRDATYIHAVHCQDRRWTATVDAAKTSAPPRYSLRMHRGMSEFTPDEKAAMHVNGLLSIPCDQPVVVGRDAWSNAFGARFRSFPIRFIPRCQLYLRPHLQPDGPNEGVELVNCGDISVNVCDRWVNAGETCKLQHGDKISWIISKVFLSAFTCHNANTLNEARPQDCYSFPLAYVLMDTHEALTLTPHNYTFLPTTIQSMFAPLLDQFKMHLTHMPPTIQRVFGTNTVKRIQLSDSTTDTPVALMPMTYTQDFEFQVFWRHPIIFALRQDQIGHLTPDTTADLIVQMLGIAASNAGSQTIHDHEVALSTCLRIAKQLNVVDLRPLPSNYFIQQNALQNVAECYAIPQP